MTLSLSNSDQDLKINKKKISKKNRYQSLTLIAGVLGTLLVFWSLAQLPALSFWLNDVVGEVAITWFWRIACFIAGFTIVIAAIKVFFSYVREELGLGPTPICVFFLVGLILSLLS